jgi:hypothetical protein
MAMTACCGENALKVVWFFGFAQDGKAFVRISLVCEKCGRSFKVLPEEPVLVSEDEAEVTFRVEPPPGTRFTH